MKNIKILTFSRANSFGALLQCYALSRLLRDKGYKVELVDIPLNKIDYGFVGNLTSKYRTHITNKFRKKWLPNYVSKDKIHEDDLYIVGSDQVWNPDLTQDKALLYFFDFLPDTVSRISYAGSFGNSSWKNKEIEQDVKKLLKKFTHIGVREQSGVEICKETFDVRATINLDPTLILDNYDCLLNKTRTTEKTLVGFKLATSPGWYDLMRFISKKRNLSAIALTNNKYNKGIKNKAFPSVEDWLSAISNCDFVITDSFHCTVFAILFKKEFIVVPANPKRMGRVTHLLSILGIENRYFENINDIYTSNIWNSKINYENVHEKLKIYREASIAFLQSSIKG